MSSLINPEIDKCFVPQLAEFPEFAKTWHKLETLIDGPITKEKILAALRVVRECGLKPVFEGEFKAGAEIAENCDLSDYKLLFADLSADGKGMIPLHVPKRGFTTIQNERAFDTVCAGLELAKVKFEIASVLTYGSYSNFCMSLVIKGHDKINIGKLANGAHDEHRIFYGFTNSHNGVIIWQTDLTSVRRVCANTDGFAIAESEQNGRRSEGKHTANSVAEFKAESIAATVQDWLQGVESYRDKLQAIRAIEMNETTFQHFIAGMFTNETTDELSTNSYNRIVDMTPRFNAGMGNSGKTRYDGYNAVTEFFTHYSGDSDASPAKRFSMANFGRGRDWKNAALEILTHEPTFKDAVKRGRVLFKDKAKVEAMAN